MNRFFLISVLGCLTACGGATSSAGGDDAAAVDDSGSASDDTASGDTSSTGDGTNSDTSGADSAAEACAVGISLSGGPAFLPACFAHNDSVNPKPVELKMDGKISIEFTQRGAAAPDTLILTVVWDEADAGALKRVGLATGNADYTSFDTTETCGLGCTSASQGVTVDAGARTIKFVNTALSHYNLYGGGYNASVKLNGTLSF